MITVVAALIEKDGKYLIARRSTGSEDVRNPATARLVPSFLKPYSK